MPSFSAIANSTSKEYLQAAVRAIFNECWPVILNPAVRIESGGQEGKFRSRRVWISEPVPKNEAKDRRPALGGSELLRNLPDSLKECAHGFQSTADGRGLCMHTGDRQRRLVAMCRLPCDAVQQQRSACHSLSVPMGNRESGEQRPLVVDQRNGAGQNLTASQVMRGKAGPAPLVL